jgi:hypothetical protein
MQRSHTEAKMQVTEKQIQHESNLYSSKKRKKLNQAFVAYKITSKKI